MVAPKTGAKAHGGPGPKVKAAPKTKAKPKALHYENVSDETDYYVVSGAALLPSQWTLQLALMTPMLDDRKGVVNTADVVVAIPWPLAKALAYALQKAVTKHDATPLSDIIKKDIEANGGLAKSLIG